MKKIYLVATMVTFGLFSFGQSIDDINELMGKNQYKKAKEGIDKFMKDPKNSDNSDSYYFKGRIYNSLSRDTTVNIKDAMQYKTESFNAFKKLQEIDKKDIRLKLENYLSYFDLYNGFFDLGAKCFNNHDFDGSFTGFKSALQVEDYIKSKGYEVNGFKFPTVDTSLILNIAITARQAKKDDEAINYYKMLEAANVSAENYVDIYGFLAQYYYNKKDKAAFAAIVEKGKKYYPKEPYWDESYFENIEIDNAVKGLTKEDLLKKYDELLVQYPNNFMVHFNYSVELYKYIYSDSIKHDQVAVYKTKFEGVLRKAIDLKSTPEGNFLMANYFYNNSFDIGDEIKKVKGTKPEDVKKRTEWLTASKKALDDCIPYSETAIGLYEKLPKLKFSEKTNLKQCYDMLTEIYRSKGDAKKSADYKAKKDALDK